MNFYSIQNSLSQKILGHYPQVKSIHYNCDVWDEPKFIEHIHFEKVTFEPIIANAILNKKSKQTDLISTLSAIGFSKKLLLSEKLKQILQSNRKTDMQFFKSPIIQNNSFVEDYWILNLFKFNMEFIDFTKSEISYSRKADNYSTSYSTIKEYLKIDNKDQFEIKKSEALKRQETISIEKLSLMKENVDEDFFMINNVFGGLYYVSENLKKEIEDAACTGIEFQPIELSLNEWLNVEREKIYGKS